MSSLTSTSPIHVVLNEAAGHNLGGALLESHVVPRIEAAGRRARVWRTERAGDGARIGHELLKEWQIEGSIGRRTLDIVVLGGDGTTHELVNGFLLERERKVREDGQRDAPDGIESRLRTSGIPQVELAIVPTGTANALFASLYPPDAEVDGRDEVAHKLRSLDALLLSSSMPSAADRSLPLSLVAVKTFSSTSPASNTVTISHIVTSTCLHAAILNDSEALRQSHPGIERFKLAAQKNWDRWYYGSVKLLPYSDQDTSRRTIKRYHPKTGEFMECQGDEGGEGIHLDGPFVYFAALTVDRLESHFVPAPFSKPTSRRPTSSSRISDAPGRLSIDADRNVEKAPERLYRPAEAVDVVIVRPLRDPLVRALLPPASVGGQVVTATDEATAQARTQFSARRLGRLTAGMYDRGKHIHLTYPDRPSLTASSGLAFDDPRDGRGEDELELEERGEGEPVVEYYRIGGFEWLPNSSDDRAHLACMDGTVVYSSKASAGVAVLPSGSADNAAGGFRVAI